MNEWPNVVAAILTLPLLAAVPASSPRRTVEVRSYRTTIVLDLDAATIEGLRRP
jgi:hypothetical protein